MTTPSKRKKNRNTNTNTIQYNTTSHDTSSSCGWNGCFLNTQTCRRMSNKQSKTDENGLVSTRLSGIRLQSSTRKTFITFTFTIIWHRGDKQRMLPKVLEKRISAFYPSLVTTAVLAGQLFATLEDRLINLGPVQFTSQ